VITTGCGENDARGLENLDYFVVMMIQIQVFLSLFNLLLTWTDSIAIKDRLNAIISSIFGRLSV